MKKRNTILFLTAALSVATLSAYRSSPSISGAGNRTGSPGSTANCSSGGCHAASSSKTTIAFMITKPATPSIPETSYTPGVLYNVSLTGNNTSALSKFGFQATVTNAGGTTVGTINSLTSAHAVNTVGTVKIIEHTTPLTGAGGTYVVNFTWLAPAAGSGPVTFYGIMNGVNGDNSTGGDEPSFAITKTLTEATASIAEQSINTAISIVPNPASETISIKGIQASATSVAIFSANGALLLQTQQTEHIDISRLANGTYILQVQADGQLRANLFYKQ